MRGPAGVGKTTMLLRHLHLPGTVSYSHASNIQDKLVRHFLAHKASPSTIPAPDPTIITAQFAPTYTCGRREIGTVTAEQRNYLTSSTPYGRAEFHEALRGGQTTFHGPGQLVAYPVLDLKRHGLSPRCYVHALESAVIRTCANHGVEAGRTGNPGVWVTSPLTTCNYNSTDDAGGATEKKICALGVHLRRNVSSHGIGLNVSTELGWFGRIVACGLEGKGTTSLLEQGVSVLDGEGGIEEVAGVFVRALGEELEGVEAVVGVGEGDLD